MEKTYDKDDHVEKEKTDGGKEVSTTSIELILNSSQHTSAKEKGRVEEWEET